MTRDYAYVLHAFNRRGEQLCYHTYGSEYEPEFARSDEYETIRWSVSRSAGLASGHVLRYPRYANATGAPGAWMRNRIAYFEVRHNGDLLARYMRQTDGAVRMFVIGIDGEPIGGYSVFREGSGYTVRFNGEPIMHSGAPVGDWADARAAFGACRRHADGGYLPGDIPDSQHRAGFSTVGARFDSHDTAPPIMADSATEPVADDEAHCAPNDAAEAATDAFGAVLREARTLLPPRSTEHAAWTVARGMAYLDERVPGWHDSVSTPLLRDWFADMLSGTACAPSSAVPNVDQDTRDYWRRELTGLGVTSEYYRVKFTSDTGVTKWLLLPAAVFNAVHDVMLGE